VEGEVAGHHVAGAVGGVDEGGCRLDGVLVVPDRDVAASGELADHPGAGRQRVEVVVEHDGVAAGLHGGAAAAVVGGLALGLDDHAVHAALRRADGIDDDDVGEQVEHLLLEGRGEDHRAR
jgi:hypothetical protein